MNPVHASSLRCPLTGEALSLEVAESVGGRIRSGTLRSSGAGHAYPIVEFIPRFVSSDNYARTFGLQWNRHSGTQQDAESGTALSRRRFFDETKWPTDLSGARILEAGCGAGRFTAHAASTGAFICSFDYSSAVEAAYRVNGHFDNVLFVQADIYRMPFASSSFDRVFCFGVLQHTPDPAAAFEALVPVLKPGGHLAIDVYKKKRFTYLHLTKYWVRPLTTRMDPERLYRWIVRYIDAMWPLAGLLRRIPKWGVQINWRLLIADHSHWGVPEEKLKEWAYLDTFDMLSPKFDQPQTIETVRSWFARQPLDEVDVQYGYNGIEGRAHRVR